MADFKQNYFQRRTKDRGPRSNNRISSPEIQVIGNDGENLGILNTNEAISMAKNQGLWANIHAKRKRIAKGSGEKMRKKGAKGAPTDKAIRDSQSKTA